MNSRRRVNSVVRRLPHKRARSMIRLLLTVLLCSSCALAAQSKRPSRKADILRLEEDWRSAQQHNDRAAFDRLLAPEVTFVGTSGSLRDKKDYIASRAGSSIPRAATYTVHDLSVRFYGWTAIVTGTEETTGEGITYKGRFTHVWARRAGRWQLVAIQRTDIATLTTRTQQIFGGERRKAVA
jgi:hypothetical protein